MESGLSPEVKAKKRVTQRERILELLRAKKAVGVTSEELNPIAFRYSSVIHGLRQQGFNIETRGRSGTELARFILWAEPGEVAQLEMFI